MGKPGSKYELRTAHNTFTHGVRLKPEDECWYCAYYRRSANAGTPPKTKQRYDGCYVWFQAGKTVCCANTQTQRRGTKWIAEEPDPAKYLSKKEMATLMKNGGVKKAREEDRHVGKDYTPWPKAGEGKKSSFKKKPKRKYASDEEDNDYETASEGEEESEGSIPKSFRQHAKNMKSEDEDNSDVEANTPRTRTKSKNNDTSTASGNKKRATRSSTAPNSPAPIRQKGRAVATMKTTGKRSRVTDRYYYTDNSSTETESEGEQRAKIEAAASKRSASASAAPKVATSESKKLQTKDILSKKKGKKPTKTLVVSSEDEQRPRKRARIEKKATKKEKRATRVSGTLLSPPSEVISVGLKDAAEDSDLDSLFGTNGALITDSDNNASLTTSPSPMDVDSGAEAGDDEESSESPKDPAIEDVDGIPASDVDINISGPTRNKFLLNMLSRSFANQETEPTLKQINKSLETALYNVQRTLQSELAVTKRELQTATSKVNYLANALQQSEYKNAILEHNIGQAAIEVESYDTKLLIAEAEAAQLKVLNEGLQASRDRYFRDRCYRDSVNAILEGIIRDNNGAIEDYRKYQARLSEQCDNASKDAAEYLFKYLEAQSHRKVLLDENADLKKQIAEMRSANQGAAVAHGNGIAEVPGHDKSVDATTAETQSGQEMAEDFSNGLAEYIANGNGLNTGNGIKNNTDVGNGTAGNQQLNAVFWRN